MTMVRHPAAGLALVGLLALAPRPAAAQTLPAEPESAAPAHVAVVDGVAVLERQGVAEAAAANVPLLAGDRLRTERGRVEVLFGDGSALDLDQFTTITLPSDTLLTVLTGRVRLTIDGSDPAETVTYRIDTPGGTVDIRTVGEYRVTISEGAGVAQVELAVVRGWADLAAGDATVSVRAGERAVARADAPPSIPYVYNAASWDAFDRWSEDRRAERLGTASSAYLPSDLVQYGGALDRYGAWERNPTYGYVWYPAVGVGWRPYYHGRWDFVASFGWTWVGFDAWSWPTHHYGRWGLSAGRWYWIPGRHWGPAWVSWASAPSYVAWCPLGYDGFPVVSFSAFWSGGSYPGYRHHPWTVLPARHFGRRGHAVSTYALAVTSIDRATRARFAERRPAGLAVPRSNAIVSAGTRASRAVPRAGTGDRSTAVRGLAAGARPGAAPTRGVAAPRSPTSQRSTLGSLASQTTRTRAAPAGSPSRTIRIVGQPRAPAPASADAAGTVDGPTRQPPSAASTVAGTSRAVPRAGLVEPGAARRVRSTPGTSTAPDRPAIAGPTRSAPIGRSRAPAAPRGGARAPLAAPQPTGGARAPPARTRSTSGIRAPSTPSRPTGGVRAPSAPSRPTGGVRAPSAPSRPTGGVRAPSAPSRPTGGVRAPSAPSRAPGVRAPSGGARAPAASRGPSGGGRAAPRATAPKGRPGGGQRPRGGSE